jgi:AraC-like DNA-binding protein
MIFTDKVSRQFYVTNIDSLTQVERNVSELSNIAMNIAYQIYEDVAISKIIFYGERDAFSTSNAIRQLENYRRAFPFISSIYIYNPDNQFLLVNNGNMLLNIAGSYEGELNINNFDDKEAIDIMLNYKSYTQYTPIARSYTSGNITSEYYTYVKYNLLTGSNSVILLNISRKWLDDIIQQEYFSKNKYYTAIFDDSGKVVFSSPAKFYASESNISAIWDSIHPTEDGYTLADIDSEKTLVVYTRPDANEWRYIRIIPYKTLTSEITSVQILVICITAALFAASLIVSLFVSIRVSAPITTMKRRLQNLDYLWYKNMRELKSNYLRDLLFGSLMPDLTNHNESMEQLGIYLPVDGPLAIVLIKIDHFSVFLREYNIKEQGINYYAIMNIACEILSNNSTLKTEAVRVSENGIAIIIGGEGADSSARELLIPQMLEIQKILLSHFDISLSLFASVTVDSIHKLSGRLSELLKISFYSFIYGSGAAICENDIEMGQSCDFSLLDASENKIVTALMQGKTDSAKQAYIDFVNCIGLCVQSVYDIMFSKLFFSLNKSVTNIITSEEKRENIMLDPIDWQNIEEIEEINEHVFCFFDKIGNAQQNRTAAKKEGIVQNINNIIEEEYCDANLSVNLIAEKLSVSVSYISKAYKESTGRTILEQIAATRMQKAEELLANTDISIVEVASRSGVQNITYFYRLFKTRHGVTPAQFRACKKH